MLKNIILAVFILYSPFQLMLPQGQVLNVMNLFLILLLMIFIFAKSPGQPGHKANVPLYIFLFIWVCSFLHSLLNPNWLWMYEIAKEFKRLITIVLGYFVFARCLKDKKEVNLFFTVFLLSIFLVGIYTWKNGMLAGAHYADFKRSSGPFGYGWQASDIAGGFLATFIPFLLSYALFTKKNIFRAIAFIGLGLSFLGIFTTYSRGSIMALGVSVAIIILFSLRFVTRLPKSSLAALILLISLGIFGWRSWVPQSFLHRIQGTIMEDSLNDSTVLDKSSERRIDIWKASFELFRDNPLFGIGFKQVYNRLGVDPHNTFILIAAEMGVFGLLVFLWFLWGIFRESLFLLNTEFIGLGIGFIGCIAAFITVNMFYANFFRDTVAGTFWIILGIMAASKKYALQEVLNNKHPVR